MSLTRRMLKALGIEEDAVEQIIEAHTETTDSLKAERDRYKEEAGKASTLRDELDTARKELEEARDTSEFDKLKALYDEEHTELEELRKGSAKLQEDFAAYKAGVEERDANRAKTNAYRELLVKAGIAQKYVGPVMKVADVSNIEIDEAGNVKGQDELIEGVKKDWAEFIPRTETKGAEPETPPKGKKPVEGANPLAVKIAKERHDRIHGSSEE